MYTNHARSVTSHACGAQKPPPIATAAMGTAIATGMPPASGCTAANGTPVAAVIGVAGDL